MIAREKLKKSLRRYAYWNFLLKPKRAIELKRLGFKETTRCQIYCGDTGGPCGK